jgi:hypothetical protein
MPLLNPDPLTAWVQLSIILLAGSLVIACVRDFHREGMARLRRAGLAGPPKPPLLDRLLSGPAEPKQWTEDEL